MKIQRSAEWVRVDGLPRRDAFDYGFAPIAERFRKPGGTQYLRGAQRAALGDLILYGGLLGAIGVGEGKTLITLLAAGALGATRPVLLLPAGLIEKTKREAAEYAKHWVFELPAIISYETLSRVGAAKYLDELEPDCIIADEAHKLKNPKAAATRRVFRYVRARNKQGVRVPCVFLAGTLTRKSILDYWHLASLALRQMPLPRSWSETVEWADAIDENVEPWARPDPGPLLEWGPADEPDPVCRARLGYQRRLRETPGVVCTSETAVGASLQIGFHIVDMPDAVADAMAQTEATWTRPDGYEFCDALSRDTIMRQLALGFYYRWREQPPLEWRRARAAWCAFVRDTCHRSRKYDTEMQVALACKRGELDPTTRRAWVQVRDTFKPVTECVWIDRFALEACRAWWLLKTDDEPSLIWTHDVTFGKMLASLAGLQYYGEGGVDNTGVAIEQRPGTSCVLSMQANREGRNLQRWARNLVTSPPSAADHWEQLAGRTHRPGQTADTVFIDVLVTHALHVESFARARQAAHYLEDTLGQKQRLLYADIIQPTQEQE